MIVDFCAEEVACIKSFATKEKEKVQVTMKFLSGKMLMFAKLSLMSFIYEMLERFCFPNEKVKEIYNKYLIEKVYMYHVLTNTDSNCLQFLFISDPKSNICKQKYGEIIFEVIVTSKTYNRFDSPHQYWDLFNSRQEILHKCLGYFEIENFNKTLVS